MKSATTAGWPAKIRRRDGTLVPFDVKRIEAAVGRAAREVAYNDPDMPVTVARAVADALGPRLAPVEEIQDFVAARLGEAGLDDVARAYIIYRQRRAELRTAKALLGVRDELKLSLAAVTVLRERYLLRDEQGRPTESTGEMMDRAARCVAAAEDDYQPGSSTQWAERFSTLMRNLDFLPNSPTLMNAGTDLGLLAGCFVLPVEDSLHSIFTTLGQAAEIQRAGGGTGYAFSHLRPAGDRVATTGGTASGPVSFLRLYDTAAGVVSLGGRRRGACMAVLDASHPDVYDFITTKADSPSELTHFNLSVGVTDAFMRAVERGATHRVINPRTGKTVARLPAAKLFDIICGAAHVCGDPGLVFLDTINRANPLPGRGRIEATNPCGEVPLLPYESCNLGSINLARMITDGRVDWDRLNEVVGVAVRFLDDVIDVSRYPFPELARGHSRHPQDRAGSHGVGGTTCHTGHSVRQRGRRAVGRPAHASHTARGAHGVEAAGRRSGLVSRVRRQPVRAFGTAAQRAGHLRRPDRHHLTDRRHHRRNRANVCHRLHAGRCRQAPAGGQSVL